MAAPSPGLRMSDCGVRASTEGSASDAALGCFGVWALEVGVSAAVSSLPSGNSGWSEGFLDFFLDIERGKSGADAGPVARIGSAGGARGLLRPRGEGRRFGGAPGGVKRAFRPCA